MKKLAIIACLVNGCVLASEATLKVFTWEEYFDPELVLMFESTYNADLEFIYYEKDENRDQVMAETLGLGMDVILIDEAEIGAYRRQDWLAPLDKEQLTYLADHGEGWQNGGPQAKDYAVPYGWGSYGITYRKDLVSQPIPRWADLFDPSHEISGYSQMSYQVDELLAIALIANGFKSFEIDTSAITKTEASLNNQQSLVAAYKILELETQTNLLSTGTVKAAMTYSSDALFLMEKYENLSFVSPVEDSIYWIDLWGISASSQHKLYTQKLLYFVLQPEVFAKKFEYHNSATFSKKTKLSLPVELQTKKILHPKNLESAETFSCPKRQTISALVRLINTLDFV